jgi:hypothetical protein
MLGSSAGSEQHLVDQLADALRAGTLNLDGRNFFSSGGEPSSLRT